jgi:hypothetical protein
MPFQTFYFTFGVFRFLNFISDFIFCRFSSNAPEFFDLHIFDFRQQIPQDFAAQALVMENDVIPIGFFPSKARRTVGNFTVNLQLHVLRNDVSFEV